MLVKSVLPVFEFPPVAIAISADIQKCREMVSKLVDLWELGILGDMQVF
jgi:hypothetical protein